VGGKNYGYRSANAGRPHKGRVRRGISSSCTGGPGNLPQENFEYLHAPRCNLVH